MNLYSRPASSCFSTTSSSRTIRSVVRDARRSGRGPAAECALRRGRCARSAEARRRCRSSRLREGRCFAVNALRRSVRRDRLRRRRPQRSIRADWGKRGPGRWSLRGRPLCEVGLGFQASSAAARSSAFRFLSSWLTRRASIWSSKSLVFMGLTSILSDPVRCHSESAKGKAVSMATAG